MAFSTQDLLGREIYARDGVKLGTIKEVACEGECVLVQRGLFSKLVVPLTAIASSEERLVVPLSSSYLDAAPKVDVKKPLSAGERTRLGDFYTPHAA
jgi:sporulation protein YlmC with PRC-barrel domain